MVKKIKKKKILNLFIGLIIFNIIFLLTIIFLSTLYEKHSIFIFGIIFLICSSVLILSFQEHNRVLNIGCILLMLAVVFEIIAVLLLAPLGKVFDIIFFSLVTISLGIFTNGIYIETTRKQKLSQLYRASYELNEAIYIEYNQKNKNIYIEFSYHFIKKYHMKRKKIQLNIETFKTYIHEEDLPKIKLFNDQYQEEDFEYRIRLQFPGMCCYAHVLFKGTYASDESFICIGFDISELEKTHHDLVVKSDDFKKLESESNKILENTQELIIKLSLDGTILYANENYSNLYSLNREAIFGINIFDLETKSSANENWLTEVINNHYSKGQTVHAFNGKEIVISWTNDVVLDDCDNVEYVISVGHDITDLIEANKRLEVRSRHNSLTGLLNYRGLFDSLKSLQEVNNAVSYFIDIRNFSPINDYYGIKIGEKVIVKLADELKQFSFNQNIVSRYNGDQFVVMLINPTLEAIEEANKKMQNLIMRVYEVDNIQVQVKMNIGYAKYPDDTNDLEELISHSSLAMKESDASIHNVLMKYEDYMRIQLHNNINIATKLRNAVKDSKIQMHFQKVYNTDDNQITCIESLARWFDEDLGYIRPDYFLKVAYESNLIDYVEEYLISQSIYEFSLLKNQESYKNSKLALNVTPYTFLSDNFFEYILDNVKLNNLNTTDICIEVCENTFINDLDICNYYIKKYKQAGFLIAIDDFGSQYSSLSVLDYIDYDIIKIDGSIVKNIDSSKNYAIVEMIEKIAKLSNKMIIAEGVETETISKQLRLLNCNIQQGYFFHKPERL